MVDRERETSALDEAETALEEGNYEDAIEGAKPFLESDQSSVRVRAKRLTGLAHFQRGEYARAVPFLREVAEAEETTDAWFNVATSATEAGQVATGIRAFGRATELNDSEALPLPQMHYFFAQALTDVGEYERALEPLEWLRDVYADLGITDGTFLQMRGVPFLSHTLEVVVEVFAELDRGGEGRRWLEALASEVDERGRETIDRYKQQLS